MKQKLGLKWAKHKSWTSLVAKTIPVPFLNTCIPLLFLKQFSSRVIWSTRYNNLTTLRVETFEGTSYAMSCKASRKISCWTKKLLAIGLRMNVCVYAWGGSPSVCGRLTKFESKIESFKSSVTKPFVVCSPVIYPRHWWERRRRTSVENRWPWWFGWFFGT